MLGFIEVIFDIIGLVGIFNANHTLIVIGLVAIIICDLYDTFILGQNGFTINIAILLAIGMSFYNKNPLNSFTLLLCGESLIMTGLTIIIVIITWIRKVTNNKKSKADVKDIKKKE